MVHPVKTPLGAARAVTHLSFTAVRHPIRTVGEVTSLGRGLVGSVVTLARPERAVPDVASGGPVAQPSPGPTGSRKTQGDALLTEPPAEPVTHPAAPRIGLHDQVVTEPSSVTGAGDDEEIPSPAVDFVEDDVEVITPVGTTGAGPGFNPDTGETDLQQPGTEPLMDPATTKRIKAESDVLRRASDPQKD